MKDGTVTYLVIICMLLMLIVAVVNIGVEREMEIIIDEPDLVAAAKADPQAPMLFAPCPLLLDNGPPPPPEIERV